MAHVKDFRIANWNGHGGCKLEEGNAALAFGGAPMIKQLLNLMRQSSTRFEDAFIRDGSRPLARVTWQPADYRSSTGIIRTQLCEAHVLMRGWALPSQADPFAKLVHQVAVERKYPEAFLHETLKQNATITGNFAVVFPISDRPWTRQAGIDTKHVAAALAGAYFTLLRGLFTPPESDSRLGVRSSR